MKQCRQQLQVINLRGAAKQFHHSRQQQNEFTMVFVGHIGEAIINGEMYSIHTKGFIEVILNTETNEYTYQGGDVELSASFTSSIIELSLSDFIQAEGLHKEVYTMFEMLYKAEFQTMQGQREASPSFLQKMTQDFIRKPKNQREVSSC